LKFLNYTWATWFGSGFCPLAPGTAGSMAAIPFVWWFASAGHIPLLMFALFTFFTGVYVSGYIMKDQNAQDPQIVVIDEVCGMAISLLLIPSAEFAKFDMKSFFIILASFSSFRLFDIWKPWPASYFDGKMHNAWGMMLDDVAAGIYSMIATFALYRLYDMIF